MKLLSVDVNIADGKVTPVPSVELPRRAKGILTVLAPEGTLASSGIRSRVKLPLIVGEASPTINPTRDQLDESAWGD